VTNYLTYSFRIKDSKKSLKRELFEKARAVNFVWNFCNETQLAALRKEKLPWEGPTGFELSNLTAGSSKELRIPANTIQSICTEYDTRRRKTKKKALKWRSKKSLPWIPLKTNSLIINLESNSARFSGLEFKFWNSRPIKGTIKSGNVVSDNRGRWYLNLTCEVPEIFGPVKSDSVGIDLGLKDIVALSTGKTVKAVRYTRQYENKLAKAQRANKKKQVQNIHKKIANSRKDFNHKLSTEIVSKFGTIVVGNVSSTDIIAKDNMAKSVYDAGWFQLKTFLKYKASARGSVYKEVSEKYSTQICSECGCISSSSPKGVKGLKIREWSCNHCGTKHNRDINAAKNILRFRHESPPKLDLIKPDFEGNPMFLNRGMS
jgi:IS605 OrfB family transposase